ncbi:OsmC family protein [Reichenbachiella sp. MSK19-1]|uniref:OsmC family protein n=1 Tax=Reichenbachiella sp. MSK19-1 TaxID=1897631 RepID=UPI000E6BC14F|nr:OsmC family protein [Reichenbachiella sp. MSK19-1]RJE70719.1 osmotically inducible protein C [Reichenbachiella sp. MSK19-1]
MNYSIKAEALADHDAVSLIKDSEIKFGTTAATADSLANPAELFLCSLAACVLKNVERFSSILKFEYEKAEISVEATRLDKPPRMDAITYELKIYSQDDHINLDLLKKNIESFGTIYNTLKATCRISGQIHKITQF